MALGTKGASDLGERQEQDAFLLHHFWDLVAPITGHPAVAPLQRKMFRVIEVPGRSKRLLVVAGLAFLGQPAGVDILVTEDALLLEIQKGVLTRMRKKIRKCELHAPLLLMARPAFELAVPAREREDHLGVAEVFEILPLPGLLVDKRRFRAAVFMMARRAFHVIFLEQIVVESSAIGELPGNLLMTSETTARDPQQGMATVAVFRAAGPRELAVRCG
jgi:hypothetical protein